jgi:2'-5' RNA ligase
MRRLFLAAQLPNNVVLELIRIQPQPTAGIKLADSSQMLLVFYELGYGEIDRIGAALTGIERSAAMEIVIEGVGMLRPADGPMILHAGVRESAGLLGLRAQVSDKVYYQHGSEPNNLQFTPHIPIARCSPTVATSEVESFLGQHKGLSLPAMLVAEFGLYSFALVGDVLE